MKLSALLSSVPALQVRGTAELEIASITEDSRAVEPGALFFARAGKKTSGLNYVREALARGAAAVIAEEEVEALPSGCTQVMVASIADAQAAIARAFYGNPSRDLAVVGVTGTNGKTTFTYLLEAIARARGLRTGVIGTVNYRWPPAGGHEPEVHPAPNTTPNALELQKLFHEFRAARLDLAVMEVSSHALALGRAQGVEFDGAVFTNLTQDHLDFHKSMEAYFEAKARLFHALGAGRKPASAGRVSKVSCDKFCIINFDDAYGEKMARAAAAPVAGYGLKSGRDFCARELQLSAAGSSFILAKGKEEVPVRLRILGEHNVYNALAALAAADRLGFDLRSAAAALADFRSVPGRLEPVECGQDFTVLVDYAHTEDALKNVLAAVRALTRNRVLTLFGCGGDRDRSKRPLMGAVAVEKSDYVVVTSDNSRSEDPRAIVLDIEVGMQRAGKRNYEVVLDRAQAIAKILGMARRGDVVLLAGKGHEDYQILADRTLHFDDREVARAALSRRA